MGKITMGVRSMTKGELYESQYNGGRNHILLALGFTAINCLLAAFGGGVYFLFSCSFPYAMVVDGLFWTGLMYTPEEYAEYGYTAADMEPMSYLYLMISLAVLSLGALLLCWFLSKKRVGWLIAGASLFVLDTLFLFLYYGPSIDFLLDYLFHAWVLFVMIRGIIAHFKRKQLQLQAAEVSGDAFVPVDEQATAPVPPQDIYADIGSGAPAPEAAEASRQEAAPTEEQKQTSPVLHMADYSVKNRILLIIQWESYEICYRRVGTVNELVVNSLVYDLIDTGRLEPAHELCCMVDGHEIKAGTGTDSFMFITFDGKVVKRKLRMV